MGRKPTINLSLPPRLRVKTYGAGKPHYYYDAGGKPRKWIPLGSDRNAAYRQYAELEGGNTVSAAPTFAEAAAKYAREVLPGKAPRTQRDNEIEIAKLNEFFQGAPLDEIRPKHCNQYGQWRKAAPVRANREMALFRHIFDKARGAWGMTDAENPAHGYEKFAEQGRKHVDVDDTLYARVYAHADQPLRDALDMAYLTAQRPADVRKLDARHIINGELHIRQGKTQKALRISITGELAALLDRIATRKREYKIYHTALLVDERGQPLGKDALRYRFDKARRLAGVEKAAYQYRDLRGKAVTDIAATGDLKGARDLAGHASVTTTEGHYERARGCSVKPTK
jgi:site-specific recombinase XerD